MICRQCSAVLAAWSDVSDWKNVLEDAIVEKYTGDESAPFEHTMHIGQWHGTIEAKEEKVYLDASWELDPRLHGWQVVLEQKQPCRRLRKQKWGSKGSVICDPAQRNFKGDCLYASLAYMIGGQVPGRADMVRVRLAVRHWFSSHPEDLQWAADLEGETVEIYVTKYVMKGWGGLPEVVAASSLTGWAIHVVNINGETIFRTHGEEIAYQLVYHSSHYMVTLHPAVL